MGLRQHISDGENMKTAPNGIRNVIFCLMLGIPGAVSAQDACELHIFPTTEVTNATKLGNYGLLTDVLAGEAAPEGMIFRELPFDAQFDAVKSVLAKNPRFSGYQLILADQAIDYKSATKNKSRLTGSQAVCYSEMALTNIVFSHSALTKRKIGVMPVLREFLASSPNPKITKMGGASELHIFPANNTAPVEAAKHDLITAFQAAIQQSLDKFLKPKS
jgi:hypothetical protein